MSDLVIYLVLLALLAGFWIWELWLARKMSSLKAFISGKKDLPDDLKMKKHDLSEGCMTDVSSLDIGERRYREMTDNLHSLLKKHKDDMFVTLSLCPADLSDDCSRILHNLMPGDRLFLLRETVGRSVWFSVFHQGRLIGYISRSESAMIHDIMTDSVVSGAFVWKQNCFGECDFTDLEIVLFYHRRSATSRDNCIDCNTQPYKLSVEGQNPFILYQN